MLHVAVLVALVTISLASSALHPRSDSQCDFEVLSGDQNIPMDKLTRPVIMRDFIKDWPLHINFMEKYGNLKTSIGSESSIVYSHGSADTVLKLKDLVNQSLNAESLSFDLDILKKNPHILTAYKMPTALGPFFDSNLTSPVLSVGFARSGLPLHTHGEAVLGLISGHKRWLLYPPGSGPPAELQAEWNPFLPMHTWLDRLDSLSAHGDTSPLVCIQHPGEVVFVPAGWAHSTYNVEGPRGSEDYMTEGPCAGRGSTQMQRSVVIGIGMQNTWLAVEREQFSRDVLLHHPADYDALKGLATSIFHKAFSKDPGTSTAARHGYTPAELNAALDEAVACLKKAIVVRPNYPEARNLLVVLLFRRGDEFTAEALSATKELEQLLDGFSLSGNSERGSASSAATAARSCSPPIAEVHASRAADSYDICSAGPTTVTAPTAPTLSMTAAGSGEAVPESSARGLASAFYRLSLPLSSQGLVDDALRLLQKSIHHDSGNPKAHAQRIFLLEKSRRYAEALYALEEMEEMTAKASAGEDGGEDGTGRGNDMLAKMKYFLMKKVNVGNEHM